MKCFRLIGPVLSGLALVATVEAAPDPAALIRAQRLLQQGCNQGDAPTVLRARGAFLALLAADAGDPNLHYWVAVADWRAVPLLSRQDRAAASRHVDDGLQHCDAALRARPRFAEAFALKAGLQGLAVQFNGAAGMMLAPQMVANLARAVEVDPVNPRVHLIDGMNTLHTPAFFGGGPRPALEKLRKANSLFAAAGTADSLAPAWGRDDALLWAGRAALADGDTTAAVRFYQQALEVNPDNGWVRTSLLPAVQARVHDKAKGS